MSETTTAAQRKAVQAVAAASDTLPTIVETATASVTVPSKIVLNQSAIVIVSAVGGAAAGAGILWGVNKWRNRNKVAIEVPKDVDPETAKSNSL